MVTSVPVKVGGAIALGATVIGGSYHIYDLKNPTGYSWLKKNKQTFNHPKFAGQEKLEHGCAENIFKDKKEPQETSGEEKVYGCSIIYMDVYDSGDQFSDKVYYLNLNSEFAFRKGNEGWVINAKIDNYSQPSFVFDYLLTTYSYSNNKWTKGTTTLYSLNFPSPEQGTEQAIPGQTDKKIKIITDEIILKQNSISVEGTQRKIVVKYPEKTSGGTEYTSEGLIRNWIHNVEEYSVWFSKNEDGYNEWLFKYTEIGFKNTNFLKIFCSSGQTETCFNNTDSLYTEHTVPESGGNTSGTKGTWDYEKARHSNKSQSHNVKEAVKKIIDKVGKTRGYWKSLDEVCNLNTKRNLNDEEKTELQLYCAK